MSDNYKPSLLFMVNVGYLWHIGNSFVQSVSQLRSNQQQNLPSINILSSQAIEVLVKSVVASGVCFENPLLDEPSLGKIIDERFRKLSHRIDDLLNEVPEIKDKLNIEEILRFNETGFVDEYRISFNNSKDILCFKTSEAARYGSFSASKDIMTLVQPKEAEDFLKNLSIESKKRITEVSRFLQGIDKE